MRVLVSCPEMAPMGGAERFAYRLVVGLAELGYDVGLVSAPGELDRRLVGIRHDRFLLPPPTRSPRKLLGTLHAMRAAVAAFRPDIVHGQNVTHAVLGAAAVRLVPGPRARVVSTFHGVEPGELRVAARLFRSADATVCVSEDLLHPLVEAGYPPSRAHVVHNGTQPSAPLSSSRLDELDADLGIMPASSGRRAPLVAAVGRLESQKAYDRFLEMAAWVHRQLPRSRFVVVGDGSLRAELQSTARALCIGDHVVFTGFREDARDIIARADLLVFSSRWEGLSIAALEAIARGTPVVSTPSQGMRVLLGSGAGQVVDGGAEALGRAVLDLLLDDDRRAAMGAEGRRLAAGAFSEAEMLGNYARLYDRMSPCVRSVTK